MNPSDGSRPSPADDNSATEAENATEPGSRSPPPSTTSSASPPSTPNPPDPQPPAASRHRRSAAKTVRRRRRPDRSEPGDRCEAASDRRPAVRAADRRGDSSAGSGRSGSRARCVRGGGRDRASAGRAVRPGGRSCRLPASRAAGGSAARDPSGRAGGACACEVEEQLPDGRPRPGGDGDAGGSPGGCRPGRWRVDVPRRRPGDPSGDGVEVRELGSRAVGAGRGASDPRALQRAVVARPAAPPRERACLEV